MAFELYGKKPVSEGASSRAVKQNQISFSVSGKQKLMLGVVIGSELLTECGWTLGDKIALYFGTDADKGKLLLKKGEDGIKLSPYNKKAPAGTPVAGFLMRSIQPVAPVADFSNTAIPRGVVSHAWDAETEGFVVTLPSAFYASPKASSGRGRKKKTEAAS